MVIIIMGYYIDKYQLNRETLVGIWCIFIGQVCIYLKLVKCECRRNIVDREREKEKREKEKSGLVWGN